MNVGPAIPLRSAELYDPATGTFSPTAPMAEPRALQFAVRLESGEVLIVGGDGGIEKDGPTSYYGIVPESVERFDPATESFRKDAKAARLGREIEPVVLPDGRMLSAGIGGLALYDPESGTVQPVPGSGLAVNTAILLRDGRILVGGSRLGDAGSGVQLFDPSSGTFGSVAAAAGNVEQAIETGDRRVIVFGRTDLSPDPESYVQALTFESFDPATGVLTPITPMPGAPDDGRFTATTLADGSILFAGGAVAPQGPITPTDSTHLLQLQEAPR